MDKQALVQTIINTIDIVERVGRVVSLTRRGKSHVGLCPFHKEKTPSFHVIPEKRIFHCFGCGAGGTVVRFVMNVDGLSFGEAVRQLAGDAGIAIDANIEHTPEQQERQALFRLCADAAAFFSLVLNDTAQGKEAYAYVRSRGIDQRMIDAFDIGYALPQWDTLRQHLLHRGYTDAQIVQAGLTIARIERNDAYDRFRDRIMFPIRDAQGRVVGFGGRARTEDVQPKYMNSPETPLFHKQHVLYGFHMAKAAIQKAGTVVLFEGYVDVIKAWSAGIDNGVATLGTAFGDAHVSLLRRMCNNVVVCYDGDAPGQAAACKVLDACERVGLDASVVPMPAGMDPDAVFERDGAEPLRRRIVHEAVPALAFHVRYAQAQHASKEAAHVLVVRDVLPRIARRPTPTEREHGLRTLAAEVDFDVDLLRQQLHEMRLQQQPVRDNRQASWNTMRKVVVPGLRPAHEQAERQLLAAMLHRKEVSDAVQRDRGAAFYGALHGALAAHVYAYYAAGHPPDVHGFVAALADEELESLAISLHMQYPEPSFDEHVYAQCLSQLTLHHISEQLRDLKQTQRQLAANVHDPDAWLLAAHVGNEIVALEQHRHRLMQSRFSESLGGSRT